MQQNTLMKFDPSTRKENPYPSQAEQWRKYHGEVAWLWNPWNGECRDARDIGSDVFGLLIVPNVEPIYADTESMYKDLLARLGCTGHAGAVVEIEKLRTACGLS